MKKELMFLLFSAVLLTSCFNGNGYWNEQQSKNMVSFAVQRFNEIKNIVNNYECKIANEYYDGQYRTERCHYVHRSLIQFEIQDISYSINFNLVPNENDIPEVHEIVLIIQGPTFENPNDCVFKKENHLVIEDLKNYLDDYVSASLFINLNRLETYMNVAKNNYSEKEMSGDIEEFLYDKTTMVDYHGQYEFVKKTNKNLYYNYISMDFSKCLDKFY